MVPLLQIEAACKQPREKNEKGHGPVKINVLKNFVSVDVNEQLQLISNSHRYISFIVRFLHEILEDCRLIVLMGGKLNKRLHVG